MNTTSNVSFTWEEIKKSNLCFIEELNKQITVRDLVEGIDTKRSFAGFWHKIKMFLEGRQSTEKEVIERFLHEIPWNKLNELEKKIRKIHQPFQSLDKEILQLKGGIEKEIIRREKKSEKMMQLFQSIPFSLIQTTKLFKNFIQNERTLHQNHNSEELVHYRFFNYLTHLLKEEAYEKRDVRELEILLEGVDEVLYELMNRESKAIHDIETMLALYNKILSDPSCPTEQVRFFRKLEDTLQEMHNAAGEFQESLYLVADTQKDKIETVGHIFMSPVFQKYCHTISKVTRMYYSFIIHWEKIHFLFPSLKVDKASPLQFINLVPFHKKELEKLFNEHPASEDLENALGNVKSILVSWFNNV